VDKLRRPNGHDSSVGARLDAGTDLAFVVDDGPSRTQDTNGRIADVADSADATTLDEPAQNRDVLQQDATDGAVLASQDADASPAPDGQDKPDSSAGSDLPAQTFIDAGALALDSADATPVEAAAPAIDSADANADGGDGPTFDVASPDQPAVSDSRSDHVVAGDATDASDPLEKGLVGHWTFDEGAGAIVGDSSGNGVTGSLHNQPVWTTDCAPARQGRTNAACLHFDGTSQSVVLYNASILNFTGSITLSAWIKLDATAAGSPDDGFRSIIEHGYSKSPNAEVFLRLSGGSYEVGTWNNLSSFATSNTAANDLGVWVHVGGVYDGRAWRFYRKGQLENTRNDSVGTLLVPAPWAIGATSVDDVRHFSGSIDDVRIYNRALTDAEMTQLAGGV
jgi:hypothetical protein